MYQSNGPFPSSLVPLFQSDSDCETILMKMTLTCMKMKLHAELIFISKVSHLDSFLNRDTRELRNGLWERVILKTNTEKKVENTTQQSIINEFERML